MHQAATDSTVSNDSFEEEPARFSSGVDYHYYLDCVHCGLCTSACPTYLELGTEMDGPRGRIHLMKAVEDGRIPITDEVTKHLELCLDCRACETACPSGVQYGRLIEPFRVALEVHNHQGKPRDWFHRFVLFPLFPYAGRMRWALLPMRVLQTLRLDRLLFGLLKADRLLPGPLRQMMRMLPRLTGGGSRLPEFLPAKGKRRAKVALLTGCIADAVFRQTHWATARVLQENGCDVLVPRTQTCCGAIHYHSGNEQGAIERAIQNAQAIDPSEIDAAIVNVAGCGAMLKDYPHLKLPPEQRPMVEAFSKKVKDVSEFLAELGIRKPAGEIRKKVAYHDACHLAHAQKIRSQPRELLAAIPALRVVTINEADVCCGAAGSYNLVHPEMANRLAARKAKSILDSGAELVATPNAGCLLHIGRRLREEGASLWIGHPIELLDMSYRGATPT